MPPATRLVLNNLVAFRYNPLGFEDQLRAGLQRRLYQSSSQLLRDNFLFGGVAPRVNPAFVKLGPSMEIQPLSVFNLRVGAEFVGYYSTFGFLQSFTSPTQDYSDTRLLERRRETPAKNYATYGVHAMIEPTLQFKIGPVVLRNKLAIEYWMMRVHAGDRVFYDVTLDTLIPKAGWVMQNDLDALYMHELTSLGGSLKGARLTAGVRYTAVKPLYKSTDFAPGDNRALADNDHHRVGPLVAFTFFDRGYTSFNRPTAIVIANWYVHHRFRTGQDVSGAIPYLIVGFSFQSDLLD
ncbi:hypothetical protein A7982_13468 [Minicystis rosea]|nr:hypothetical protein A7982_13468 [Minicystis rosea]